MNANERDLLLRMADAAERTDERVGEVAVKLEVVAAKAAAATTAIEGVEKKMLGKTEIRMAGIVIGGLVSLVVLLILLLATSKGIDVSPAIEGTKALTVPS